jgi:hypothetical protein
LNSGVARQKKVVITRNELLTWTSIPVVILAVFNFYIFSSFLVPSISITSGGSQTFSIFDGALTFVINNNLNTPAKTVSVYGFNGPVSLDISASGFVEDKTGDTVSLQLDSSTDTHLDNVGSTPTTFTVGVDPLKGGLYHGAIFITSGPNNSPADIVVDVKPRMSVLIMIIIDGIALSIAAWSVIKFLNERFKIIKKGLTMEGLYIAGEPKLGVKPLSVTAFLEAKKVTRGVVLKNIILDVGTIAFGIALGLTTLVDNAFITGIHNLGVVEIIILIGIGLGIGSLKEIVYK